MKLTDQITIYLNTLEAAIKVMQSLGYEFEDYKVMYDAHTKLHEQ